MHRKESDMKKIAVYFPGIGYHCDKPLLYYSRNAACELGYENYKNVAYTYKAGNIRGNEEKMKETYETLFLQTETELADFVWSDYDDVLFSLKIKPKPDYPLKTLYPLAFQTGQNHLIYYDFTTVE